MSAEPDHPRIVAPPPLLALGAVLFGLALDRLVPLPLWPGAPPRLRLGLAIAVLALAVAVAVAALRELRRLRTTPNPYQPTTAIVSSGIYARTRNPIYIGFLLVVAAVALALVNGWIAVALVPLFLTLELGVVRREERYLTTKFGPEYDAYRARVRRWL